MFTNSIKRARVSKKFQVADLQRRLRNVQKKCNARAKLLCVEFPHVQYINLSEIIHVLKVFVFLVVSHFLSAKVFWMEVKSGFRDPKNVYLSPEQKCLLKKGTNAKIMWTFLRDQILSLE